MRKNKKNGASDFALDSKDTNLVADVILQNIEDGIVLINAQKNIVTFNMGATQITGHTIDQAVGRPWKEILQFVDKHSITVDDQENPVKQAFTQKGNIRQEDAFILSAQKTRVPLHLIASSIENTKSQVEGVIVVMRNMSPERAQEEAKTDFVSTASHEMRTPLAALEGYLSLIINQNLDSQTMEYAQKAHQNVMHLGKLFKNLLTTSQSEDGRLSHHPQIFAFNNLLDEIIAENQKQANLKQIHLRLVDRKQRLPDHNNKASTSTQYYLNADPQRIQELLNNILDNALKYTDTRGEINIYLRQVDDFLQIQIEDSGYGIAPKDLPHLFQKFYRVDNNQPGSGLGLFICKKIVELYKGDIWLESEVGKGSIFYIHLPLYIEHN